MQVLMGEREEAKIVSAHRFIDQPLPEAEIVQELIALNVVKPGENLLVEPAALLHHQHHVNREDDRHDWMFSDEICDDEGPGFLWFWLCVLGVCLNNRMNQQSSEDSQNSEKSPMGDGVVLAQ